MYAAWKFDHGSCPSCQRLMALGRDAPQVPPLESRGCTAVLAFDDDAKMREPTPKEEAEFMKDGA